MKKTGLSVVFLIVSMACSIAQPGSALPSQSMLQVNYEALVSRADLHYGSPVTKSEEGQPTGNGRMGTLVWTIPTALQFQLNRVDVFGNNTASHNFYERNTDYCGGVGGVSIDLGDEVFTQQEFSQHLSCYDGLMQVKGRNVAAELFTWHEKDVMAVKITDERETKQPLSIDLRMLRLPLVKTGDHSATSTISTENGYLVLKQEFREGNYYCASAIVIGAAGKVRYAGLQHDMTVRLSTGAAAGTVVYMASAATFDPKVDIIQKAMQQVKAAQATGYESLRNNNRQWWHQFWQQAFVYCTSADKEADFVEAHYTWYLYVMASSSRGDYPTKFNGMLWTTNGDARKWGALYWGANQSCLYNALFPTNRPELLRPMFNMYSKAYGSYERAAAQQWGSKGIFIPEVTGFDDTPPLPDSIAAEMRDLYLLRKEWKDRSPAFTAYAYTQLPFLSRWNWKKDSGWKEGRWFTSDKGGGAFGHTNHIFSRGAKIAYQYWLQYEYSQDTAWLRQFAYPMLKGVAEFYRNFPNVRKEQDGRYHIWHVNDNESIWNGHNTVEEISSMMGIFPAAIRAAELLNTDMDMRKLWSAFIDKLSPLTLSSDGRTWVGSVPPVGQGNAGRRPDGNTMPVWFFDLCNLESPDPKRLQIANNTYDLYYPRGIDSSARVFVLSKLPVAGVLLGRAEATRFLVPNQLRTAEVPVLANRMDLREGYQTTSVQRLGRAAEALQLGLCQSIPPSPGEQPVIRVFPAWPLQWDAAFTLLARGGFLVSSSVTKGEIAFIELRAQAGGTCSVRNPWPGKAVDVYINGKRTFTRQQDLLQFHTKKGDQLLLLPKGVRPADRKRTVL